MPHILIVEDELHLAKTMSDYLKQEHYQTTILERGDVVMSFLSENQVDVILLDLMLPGLNGMDVCQMIRKMNSSTPVIMTTARVDEIDRILGLEIGANDYVCKPYSPREVVARVKVQLRQLNKTDISPLQTNDNDMTVEQQRKHVQLTVVEYRLLTKMMSQPGRIYTRDQLMDAVYDDGRIVTDRTIDSHIKKLRQKLKTLSPQHNFIQAIYGCGYKFINSE
ncbi:response regulator [Marinicella rhabdoformis]|uniref:response regulator n=1 Tax=Marinicella rhabdoformis TaxID=2580566 RepID=UPI0012AED7EE|nr:response regulator [Marinicella rhabdoformis]